MARFIQQVNSTLQLYLFLQRERERGLQSESRSTLGERRFRALVERRLQIEAIRGLPIRIWLRIRIRIRIQIQVCQLNLVSSFKSAELPESIECRQKFLSKVVVLSLSLHFASSSFGLFVCLSLSLANYLSIYLHASPELPPILSQSKQTAD